MNKKVFLFYFLGLCLLCRPGLIHGQAGPLPSDKPASEVYPAMLRAAMAGDYTKVQELVVSLEDLPAEIKNRFAVDVVSEISGAVAGKDKEEVLSALRKLVLYDMRNVFAAIRQRGTTLSPKEVVALLKTAVSDYSLLSSKVKATNSKVDKRVKKLFEWAIYMVPTKASSPFTFSGGKEMDWKVMTRLTKLMEQVEQECLKVFPDSKVSSR
ncbi:MAG: hypothetical protein SWE60_02530 [Thermodesulfobacteriota bacterium]|nr:hypothetical protein [Thermodesulfobacteriota bacterium]